MARCDRLALFLAAALAILTYALQAQGSAPNPRFEVASVKPVKERPPSGTSASVFTTTGTAQSLIGFAYAVPLPLIEGGAAWTTKDLFLIRGTLPDGDASLSLGERTVGGVGDDAAASGGTLLVEGPHRGAKPGDEVPPHQESEAHHCARTASG